MLILIFTNIVDMVSGLIEKDIFQLLMKLIDGNVITCGVDRSSCSYIDNKKKDILIFGKGPAQGLEHTLTAENLYSINFTKQNNV